MDVNYIYRSDLLKAKLTGFYTKIEDANKISFFFADGIGNVISQSGSQQAGNNNAEFVQEILQGIHKNHLGTELGVESQLTILIYICLQTDLKTCI